MIGRYRTALALGALLALFALPASAQTQHDHGTQSAGTPPAAPPGEAKRKPSPPGAYVYIGWPNNGEVIYSTKFKVWFGTRNFGVAPAGTNVPNTGHHHLLIDTDLPADMNEPIPNDKNHLHFGLGQTETVIELPPGTHTLQLLMGDGDHIPQDPPLYSKKITIHIRAGGSGEGLRS
jgi:hypothetical protein